MLFFPDFDLHAFERPRIVHLAEAALSTEPRTITAVVNPRSAGGRHDFSSEGDYWWPDPNNPDGPYLRRDGLTNPDNFVAHRDLMFSFASHTGTLAAAFVVTGEERYAEAAARHLRAWFVAPQTRMNPNLQYAQSIKGVNTGRGIGIIDTVHLAEVALGVEALRKSRAFTRADDEGVTAWFRDYLHWMRTHPYGVAERDTENNHATCWALQAAAFARLTGDQEVRADCRRRLLEILLPGQMATDGSFPRETARTKPYGYALFNLDVMTALAAVLSTPDDNLVARALPDGRSLLKGVTWMAPYLADKGKWPFKQDVMYWDDWPVRQPALLFGALANGNAEWLALWKKLNPDPQVPEIKRNFPVRHPVLWAWHDGKAREKPAPAATGSTGESRATQKP